MPRHRGPLLDIPANPVGAHDWHVQRIGRTGRWVKIGGSEGIRSYARGFMVGYSAEKDIELRLCDAEGFCYEVI